MTWNRLFTCSVKVSVFEVFLVCIFPHADWIRRDTGYLRIVSECRKIRTRKTPNTDTFHAVLVLLEINITAQKMKFSIENFFSKCDQIRRKLTEEIFIFCAVYTDMSILLQWVVAIRRCMTFTHKIKFKVNESRYLWSEDLSESFSQLVVSIFIFSRYFFK